jgi:hypothetical protein
MKKEAIKKCKGLKIKPLKTFDEKEATPKCKGLKRKATH